ncbi:MULTISPECIES: LytR/AlgR family response regulator transcription factor [Acidaminococcus]|jgi:two-component system LytT family response regulator|uniref:LytR/AlgR family response regulator transcription factor n=1 Tax=Acidaminococcus TaxID=904 RepID=UPI0022E737E4|nr:LytTR family DNA-binding domain-containing protein [Acidaminococcus massiliensis]
MFHIALCDSDHATIARLTRYIHQLPHPTDAMKIYPFSSGNTLIETCRRKIHFNLVVLGSFQGEHHHLKIARVLRRFDSLVPIMVISDHIQDSLAGYEIPLYRYYHKSVAPFLFQKDLQHLLENNSCPQNHSYLFSNWQGLHHVLLKEILFFKSEGSRILVATQRGSFIYRDSIRSLEVRLQRYNFLRIHRSYMVNLHWIRNIRGEEVTLLNGRILPLAKTRSKMLRESMVSQLGQI